MRQILHTPQPLDISMSKSTQHISFINFILLNMKYEQGHVHICFSPQSVVITNETLEPNKCYRSAERHITEDSNVHSDLLPFHPEDRDEIYVWLPRVAFHDTIILIPGKECYASYSDMLAESTFRPAISQPLTMENGL
jgi:hypothetical protein